MTPDDLIIGPGPDEPEEPGGGDVVIGPGPIEPSPPEEGGGGGGGVIGVPPELSRTTLEESIGGRRVWTVFELTVSHPTSRTWLLGPVDYEPTTTWGDESILGLVWSHTGVAISAGLNGVGRASSVSITLVNALGTGGPGRRWMDQFVTNVPGCAEPYDLLTMTCRALLFWEDLPDEPRAIGSAMRIAAEGIEWSVQSGALEMVTLTFVPDERRYQTLPKHIITPKRYPHAPESAINQPVPVWLGQQIRVPLTPLDLDGSMFLVGASPTATPLSQVTRVWTIRPDPTSADSDTPVVFPVRQTTAGLIVLSLTGGGTAVTVNQVAQRFQLAGDGVFAYAIRLWLRRKVSATACTGSIAGRVVLDADGYPSDAALELATFEVNASIINGSTAFLPYDFAFGANGVSRAPFVPSHRRLWIEATYAKIDAADGDLEMEVDNTGGYMNGYLATKKPDETKWTITGRQVRRGPVRSDYTGIGYLLRNDRGTVIANPPVILPV